MTYIGLLDCNNFFVSCERLFRPDLVGKPTVVLSSNDGCVVARSQEVKDMGIPMGVPHFKVRNEFEKADVAVFSSNFTLYRDISRRVMDVLRAEVGEVEQYSVDEAFFTITAAPEDIETVLHGIKQVIEQNVGVPVSVGAAKTKTIAKCASEVGKKGVGVAVLEGAMWREHAATLAIGEVWGIGRKTAEKCTALGIQTVADYVAVDRGRISSLFGVAGIRKQAELTEQPAADTTHAGALQQSIMSTRSFSKTTTDRAVLEDAVAYHVAHAAEELRELDAVAQSLRVMIRPSRHSDWSLRGGSADVLLSIPTSDTRLFMKEAMQLVRTLYEPDVPYKKAGVVLSCISATVGQSGNLFTTDIKEQDAQLMETLDALNGRFGRNTVMLGRLGKQAEWGTSHQYVSKQYTTAWHELATVRAC